MSRQSGRMPTSMGAEGRTFYPHERPQGLMPKGDFPDPDELETGEPPVRLRGFKSRPEAVEGFDENQILHEIEANITPKLREQASDFAREIFTSLDLSDKELEQLLTCVLSVLAQSPEKDAGKRLELARRAAGEVIAKIDEARLKQEEAAQVVTGVGSDNSMRSSSRIPNRASGDDSDKGKSFLTSSRRNFGRKPKYKDKRGETIH